MTLLLAVSSAISRILGVLRSNRLADVFGASDVSDAYFAAFQIPDLLYSLIVFGAISAAFVPLFIHVQRDSKEKAWEFSAALLNIFVLMTGAICLLAFFLAEPLVGVLYSSFDAEAQRTTVELLRIMLLSPLLFAVSSIFGGIQTAHRVFWGYALAPIVYNLSILFGIVYLSPAYGIHGVAYGVVGGAALHALVQVVPCFRLGFRWRPILKWDGSIRKLFVMGIPRVLSLAMGQMNLMVEAVIATGLMAGGLTVLRFAQDLQSLPLGVIGLAVAVASFSTLSQLAAEGKIADMAAYVRKQMDQILFFLLPAMMGLILLRVQVVHLVFSTGSFDQSAVAWTEATLAAACCGLVAMSLHPLITRVFFAFHDTWFPFFAGAATLVLNAFSAYYLSRSFGVVGIALSSSMLITVQLILLVWFLKKRYLKQERIFHWRHLGVFSLATFFMTLVLFGVVPLFDWSVSRGLYAVQTVVVVAVGGAVYFGVVAVSLRSGIGKFLGGRGVAAGEDSN